MMGIQVCSNKGPDHFQGEIMTKMQKYIDKFQKSSSPEPLGQFQPNLAQIILGWKGILDYSNEGPLSFFHGEVITNNKNTLTKFENLL